MDSYPRSLHQILHTYLQFHNAHLVQCNKQSGRCNYLYRMSTNSRLWQLRSILQADSGADAPKLTHWPRHEEDQAYTMSFSPMQQRLAL